MDTEVVLLAFNDELVKIAAGEQIWQEGGGLSGRPASLSAEAFGAGVAEPMERGMSKAEKAFYKAKAKAWEKQRPPVTMPREARTWNVEHLRAINRMERNLAKPISTPRKATPEMKKAWKTDPFNPRNRRVQVARAEESAARKVPLAASVGQKIRQKASTLSGKVKQKLVSILGKIK